MLRRIESPANHKSNRLWFSDSDHDLFVWLDASGNPAAFQFSYDKNINEHAISWSLENGYRHDRIDDGESGDGRYKMSPIMTPNGDFDNRKIADIFKAISQNLEPTLVTFIYQQLLGWPTD